MSETNGEAGSKVSKGGKDEICDFVFSTTGKTSIFGFSKAVKMSVAVSERKSHLTCSVSIGIV